MSLRVGLARLLNRLAEAVGWNRWTPRRSVIGFVSLAPAAVSLLWCFSRPLRFPRGSLAAHRGI
ncbi:hypothetical protein UM93_16425 [Psychromicrobium lacuslunae]|uniref:Uncharacterized protein n=1 Tax=Psychromicrobium lacuslunae TaxID=1618207 RepID=A0A0D4C2T0_9MICC|nr:hypothetical protein UM93_16425 [Psychromicrobium lacuslunae]